MQDDIAEARGVVFNIQRFSIHDGPGIRTTVFLKGCPLRCGWCSNPESMSPYPEMISRDIKCIRCGKCVEACSQQAIAVMENTRVIQWEKCNRCMKCAEVCPSGAIEAMGTYMTVAEVLDTVGRDAGYYRRTGGGMTLSGGEPLVQWRFALKLLQEAKRRGLHTALDTTGYCPWENLEQVLEHTDLILFDVKHMDPEKHEEGAGVSNELILENLDKASLMTKIWLRIPLIPGFNDSESNMQETAELASRAGAEKISLLPYHEWGKAKYSSLGKQYGHSGADGILEPDSDVVKKCRAVLESHGLEVKVGN
jgi:pyruvate formate lyase activating enzyme